MKREILYLIRNSIGVRGLYSIYIVSTKTILSSHKRKKLIIKAKTGRDIENLEKKCQTVFQNI